MVSEMKKRDIKIGLLIDLTNTKRYYHSSVSLLSLSCWLCHKFFVFQEVTELGVGYEKIFVEGHEIPSQDAVNRFYTAIDAFENVHKESESKSIIRQRLAPRFWVLSFGIRDGLRKHSYQEGDLCQG